MIWEVGGEIRRLPASIETPDLCKAISRCVHCWLIAIFTLEGMKKGKCPNPFWPGLHKYKGIMFHKFETSAKTLNCIKLQRKHFMLHTFAG